MKINTSSWHYRIYNWIWKDELARGKKVSVCDYWGFLLLGLPAMSLLFIAFSPIILVFNWLEKTCKPPSCPLGKIEFVSKTHEKNSLDS